MRKWVGLSLAASVAIAMTGCGAAGNAGASNQSTTSNKPVTLTIWWWGQQEAPGASQWMKQTVKDFEAAHPNVTVKTVLQTTNGLYPAFEAAAKAKNGPDIEYLWGGINTLSEAWNGYLAPIDEYIPKSEWSHYLNWQEDFNNGHLWSAPWYTQPSFPMLYNKTLFKKAGLDPNNPPTTWADFVKDAGILKSHGITPIAMGAKDGWIGGWMFGVMGNQNLNSVNDLIQAQVNGNINQPKYTEWLTKIDQLNKAGYINSDATSLDLYQGQALFTQGKAAMTWVAGSAVKGFVDQVGKDNVGIMMTPQYGTGKMANTIGDTSQTLAITSFSQHKQLAAEFIEFAHQPKEMKSFYDITGSVPADNRFPVSDITLPQQKTLFDWMLHKPGAYIENFISGDLDNDGNFTGLQNVLSGTQTPAQVSADMQKIVEKWRQANPIQVKEFSSWHVQPWY